MNRLLNFRKVGLIILLLGSLALGVWRWVEPPLSWAAPHQNPHAQTIPPRPTPTPEPLTPTPGPPDPAPPTTEPTTSPAPSEENDDGDDDDDLPPPSASPTEPTPETSPPEPSPVQLPQPTAPSAQNDGPPAPVSSESGAQSGGQQGAAPHPETDRPPANNGDPSGAAELSQADVSVIKKADNSAPTAGEFVTFTTIISNSGPDVATNIVVVERLPAGLSVQSTSASLGSYDTETGLWLIGALPLQSQAALNIVAQITRPGPLTPQAEVVAMQQVDPDSTPNNQLETEDDLSSITITAAPEAPLAGEDEAEPALRLNDNSPAAPATGSFPFFTLLGSIGWLYALGIAVVLIASGIFLVYRA